MENKGYIILGKKKLKLNVWIDETLPEDRIIMHPKSLNDLITPTDTTELKKKLISIDGIGDKLANEILEEYQTKEAILSDINDGKFIIGGIDKKRLDLIKVKLSE